MPRCRWCCWSLKRRGSLIINLMGIEEAGGYVMVYITCKFDLLSPYFNFPSFLSFLIIITRGIFYIFAPILMPNFRTIRTFWMQLISSSTKGTKILLKHVYGQSAMQNNHGPTNLFCLGRESKRGLPSTQSSTFTQCGSNTRCQKQILA